MARAATTSDVFNAIAEPQRREILVVLRAGERPVTELARELGMTQPRASKHLRVLREVGPVLDRELRPAGRIRAGPEAGKAGGVADERDGTRSAGAVRDGRPPDRHLPGRRRPKRAGVRGVHRGAAPVAVVGTGRV